MKRSILLLILVFIIFIPAIIPLFKPGFFLSDDGEWMIIRFSAFHQALVNGQFPVRFLPRLNHEFGYPVANFLYPGFMYLAEIPKALGFGFVDSIKVILGLSIVSSGFFVYLWLSKIFDRFSSFLGSLVYVYTPYHLYDLYKRGSVGEILALSIVPFVFWQIERKSLLWSSLGLAFLILSHNTLAILFLPLIIFYMLLNIYVSKEKKKLSYEYVKLLIFALGISSFFWFPAIFDLQYTIFSKTPVSNFAEYFADINLIGISTIFIFALTLTLLLTGKIKISKHRLTLLFLIVGGLSLFLSTSQSSALWNFLPTSFIQFPFRLLSIAILVAAFLSAFILSVLPKRLKILAALIILLLALISSKSFLSPSQVFNKEEGFYSTNLDTTTVKNEYMPKWVLEIPKERPKNKVEIGSGEIKNLFNNGNKVSFDVLSNDKTSVQINTVYFPGWKVKIDGRQAPVLYQENGLIRFNVQKGTHNVVASFGETKIRLFSDLLSAAMFLGLVFWRLKK